jgi:hypothetical protein
LTIASGNNATLTAGDLSIASNAGYGILSADATRAIAITNAGTTINDGLTVSTAGSANTLVTNSVGYVGIGVVPSSYRLEVNGTIYTSSGGVRFPDGTTQTTAFTGTASVNANSLTGTTLASNVVSSSLTSVGTLSSLTVSGDLTVDTSTLKVDSTNNFVGIGTASPSVALDVQGVIASRFSTYVYSTIDGTTDGNLYITANAGAANTTASNIIFRSSTSGSAITERMRIDSSGNVGIGTSSPQSLLHLYGANPILRLQDSDGGDVFGLYTSNTLGFGVFNFTDSRQDLTISNDGNVGIGTTSPAQRLHVYASGTAVAQVEGSGSYGILRLKNSTHSSDVGADSTSLYLDSGGAYPIVFYTGATSTERARITSGGDVYVGSTSAWASSRFVSQTASTSAPAAEFNTTGSTSGLAPVYIWNNAESGDPYFIQFYDRGNSLARRNLGYINYKTGPGQLQLVTASDYRIKRVIGTYDKSGSVFDKIHVHEGHIYDSPMAVPFVLAHELQEAVPYAVDGEKDAVNEDGTNKLQMVGYTSLIPLMLAEIKSLRARVAALES